MGADQGWGKVVYELEQYVQASDNKEVLKIFKNKADNKWYYKNHLNQIFLLFGDGCCDYVDYMRARLVMDDNDVNYLPKTPIYDNLGVIDNNYFGDLLYAESLGAVQAFRNYNSSVFAGAFTAAQLNNINGKITIPSNGFYTINARLSHTIEPSANIGINSTISQNPKTLGEKWNSDKTVKFKSLIQIGVYDEQRGEIVCYADKELTDCGNFQIDCSMTRQYNAGEKIRGIFINNTDMDIWGATRPGSEFELFIVKVSN